LSREQKIIKAILTVVLSLLTGIRTKTENNRKQSNSVETA